MKRKIELPTLREAARLLNEGGQHSKIDRFVCDHEPDSEEWLVSVFRRQLTAALQEAYNQGYEDARPKWLPIESAPKDGTVVDLFINGDRWPDCKFENGEWLYFSEYGDHMYDPDYYPLPSGNSPTHWMPLPDQPTR